jgi:hypothetical protein
MICHMGLSDYAHYCCTGRLPEHIVQAMNSDTMLSQILCAFDAVGALEPLAAHRPPACEPVIVDDFDITVPAATLVDGVVVPTSVKALAFCAPTNKALMIKKLRITAGNLVASRQPVTMPVYKRVAMGGAGFGQWCLPFEAPSGSTSVFRNVENLLTPPQAGFSVFVENHDATGEAIYHIYAKTWTAC